MEALAFGVPAAIGLANLFSPHPSQPNPIMDPSANIPGLRAYQAQMMNNAMNPNTGPFKMASDQAMGNINADLANKGLGFSSYGSQAQGYTQAMLANEFLKQSLQNQINTYSSVMNPNIQLMRDQNQQQWNQFNASNGQDQAKWNTLAGIGSAGMGYAGMMNANNQAELARTQNQNQFNQYMSLMQGTPSGGGGMYNGPPGGPLSTMNVGGMG